jgi:hypothetical protein
MTQKYPLPHDLMRLVATYEGGALKAYFICIIRRVTVRSYQTILSRNFKFCHLPRFPMVYLTQLVHTALYSIQRYYGVVPARVYRKELAPWMQFIDTFKMRKALHDDLIRIVFHRLPPGHPMYRNESAFADAWLTEQKQKILG